MLKGVLLYAHKCQFKNGLELLEWGREIFYRHFTRKKNMKLETKLVIIIKAN